MPADSLFYDLLGVSADASNEDIRRGYRQQSLRWHPDKNLDCVEEAAEMFKLVSHAYEVLSDGTIACACH